MPGGCPRIEAVVRESPFESDFLIICGEQPADLTKIIVKSVGYKDFSRLPPTYVYFFF